MVSEPGMVWHGWRVVCDGLTIAEESAWMLYGTHRLLRFAVNRILNDRSST